MGDDNKEGFKLTWRDAFAAGAGALFGWKFPEYMRDRDEKQARYQAKLTAEELRKNGVYEVKPRKEGDG